MGEAPGGAVWGALGSPLGRTTRGDKSCWSADMEKFLVGGIHPRPIFQPYLKRDGGVLTLLLWQPKTRSKICAAVGR